MSSKRALITGIAGQDGSYLLELLLAKGYEVHGVIRPEEAEDPVRHLWRIAPHVDRIALHTASIEDQSRVEEIAGQVRPDECYHLAALSSMSSCRDDEFATMRVNVNGTHYLLWAVRTQAPECRFFFAASGEMYGLAAQSPQNERTPFHARSVYGASKVAGFELTRYYRESRGLHASSGIMFNHESPRRGLEFVSRKITSGAARIAAGQASELRLGNLEARRDWGDAREYVEAMWLMLQQPDPGDYVLATGETHSVREFAAAAFAALELDYSRYVVSDPALFRPAEPTPLVGDARLACERLGWQPRKPFLELVEEMALADRRTIAGEGQNEAGSR
jgi:GDPmannose 4,6-dehydratase